MNVAFDDGVKLVDEFNDYGKQITANYDCAVRMLRQVMLQEGYWNEKRKKKCGIVFD